MQTSHQAQQDNNSHNNPQHNFFLIIPAHVADDPDLDDSTILLYGRISALSNQSGFCWASNEFLANLTKCQVREIKNRLKALEEKGYIYRETKKIGMAWERKIYPIVNNKVNSTKGTPVHDRRAQSCPIEGHTCAPYYDNDQKDNMIDLIDSASAEEKSLEKRIRFKTKKKPSGIDSILESVFVRTLIDEGYAPEEIKEAIKKIQDYQSSISDIFAFAKKIINNKRKETYVKSNARKSSNSNKGNSTQGSIYAAQGYCRPAIED